MFNDGTSSGLLLSYTMSLAGNLSLLIILIGNLLGKMSSVEKIHEYIEDREFEKPFEIEDDKKIGNWPSEGKIEVVNLKIRYRKNLPLVLKGVEFTAEPRQKIGIVGRTGSGKSTTLLSIMRIIEIGSEERIESVIKIDGVDISTLGLHKLRNSITIIPQDPYLLEGDLRSNMDPESTRTDEEIIKSLEQVEFFLTLKGTSSTNNGKEGLKNERNRKKLLQLKVEKSGSNLSLGQRQLICIARALIRKPKILLMDEATANIDQKTDKIIQRVVTHQMPDTTVLTIAHRLNTIIQYDKIIVLEDGVKVEEGSPLDLIENDGIFSKMVQKGGKKYRDALVKMAKEGGSGEKK